MASKKAWLRDRLAEGLVFNKLDVRGKGKGYGDSLMEQCMKDSRDKGKMGLACISSRKKMPFLSDPGFLKHKGFHKTT